MLKVPDFEIRSIEETMQLIKQKIPYMGIQWNDTGESDPGITVLELFAAMNTALQERLDTVTKAHKDKYLRLLGINKEINQCSKAIVSVENLMDKPYVLLKGTKLLAGGIVFETDISKIIYNIHIEKLYIKTQYGVSDITRLMNRLDIKDYMFGKNVQAGNEFYIGLSGPLWNTTNHSLYFWLDNSYRRNPISKEIPLILSDIQWEYFDGQQWKQADVIKDETNGFLCDGFVTLHFNGNMEKYEDEQLQSAYYIKAVVKSADYDRMPMLSDISVSAVEVVQKDTICKTFLFSGSGSDRQTYLLEHALAMNANVVVEVKRENGEWIHFPVGRKPESRCNILIVDDTKPFLYFDRRIYGAVPAKGENNIRVTCYQDGFDEKRLISYGTGLIRQTYVLDMDEIAWDSFSIVTSRPTYYGKRYYDWEKIEDLADAAEEKVYQIDMSSTVLYFGDGVHGAVPAEDETIMISGLAFTKGADGNVKPDEITRFKDAEKNSFLRVSNKTKSTGGRNLADTEEIIKRLKAFQITPQRAVTKKHYQMLVKQAPGLAIEKFAVWNYWDLASFEGNKESLQKNTVYISVLPYDYKQGSTFFEKYKDVLVRYLDKYRLVTTNIEVLEPVLAGVDVYGTIYIKEQRLAQEELFYDVIRQYFLSKKEFGEELSSGELYALLDVIDSVEYIENINFECSYRGCRNGHSGNLILHPNAVCYIKSINLEFKR